MNDERGNLSPDEAQELWAQELESGRWKQGRWRMRSDGEESYCCLGVAQEVALRCGLEFIPEWGETSALPRVVEEWLFGGEWSATDYFADANDNRICGYRHSFPEIAQVIRAKAWRDR